jgi:hypothetical protein
VSVSENEDVFDIDLAHGVYVLAERADVHSPDSAESPGARFLNRCQDYANEVEAQVLLEAVRDFDGEPEDFDLNALPNDLRDDVSEWADSAVQIYTYQCWQEFTDLCLWEEDLSDLGEVDGDDLTRDVAMRAEYMVASRLIPALIAERARLIAEANPEPDDEDGDE